MSKEFIVLVVIEAIGLIMTTVTMIVLLSFIRRQNLETNKFPAGSKPNKYAEGAGIVFCRNCGKQYDISSVICPNCKTPH